MRALEIPPGRIPSRRVTDLGLAGVGDPRIWDLFRGGEPWEMVIPEFGRGIPEFGREIPKFVREIPKFGMGIPNAPTPGLVG